MRYKSGIDSYLNVLTAQTSYYAAQQTLVTARLNRLTSLNGRFWQSHEALAERLPVSTCAFTGCGC